MTRTPHADQPAVRAEFCSCEVDSEGEIVRGFIDTLNADGTTTRAWYRQTDPDCKLHGGQTQPAPF